MICSNCGKHFQYYNATTMIDDHGKMPVNGMCFCNVTNKGVYRTVTLTLCEQCLIDVHEALQKRRERDKRCSLDFSQ